jgi:aerobic-type carbon monoxide dehydrogenase small subunit (CoxS/CutS family)
MADTGSEVKLARFINNGTRLEFAVKNTREVEYIAVSHVWGDKKWRSLKCMDNEVLISDSKADFVEIRLYPIVGETYFWMDTLTVNQHNQREVIATVHSIPNIFSDAQRTLVVKQGDGMRACCADAVNTAGEDVKGVISIWFEHATENHPHSSRSHETYLERLWTLQEIMLSHTLQFVLCKNGNDTVMSRAYAGS